MPAALHKHAPTNTAFTGPSLQPGSTGAGVLKALAYFDIFQYPLNRQEIRQYLDKPVMAEELDLVLNELLAAGLIFFHNGFYSLQDNPLPACKRIKGNQRAAELLPKAQQIGRFLYRFPFVKGIGISGSLSKNFADDRADIDFFVITKANRLWIGRTLMHLFKKLTFLTGRQHFYCMNYYVDEEVLLLEDQNIFTAIELKTLLPVSGDFTFWQFFNANHWTKEWLPACEFRKQAEKDKKPVFKRFIEWLCNNKAGDYIDTQLMRITNRRWKGKEKKGLRNQKGMTMGLVTGKHFAKSNPGSFQEKVLSLYKDKLTKLGIQ
jgi:hypothetical protein